MMAKNNDLLSEIATRSRSIDYWALGGYLPNPDPVLKRMGKDISVYRELLSDPHLSGCVRRRKAAIKGLDWRLTPTGNEQTDEELYQLFLALPLNQIMTEILNATLFGYQVLEVIWHEEKSKWLPEIVAKPQEWFVFDEENRLRLRTKENWLEGELLPEMRFLLATQEATYINPYGSGDLSKCFWAATFKKGGFKYWLEFTEKYGSPWLIGKQPRQAALPDKERLHDTLVQMLGTAVAVIPNDESVSIEESGAKGATADAYNQFLKYCKAEIAIAILGQNQTTEADANRASATAGLEVVEDIRNEDAKIVESVFNQLLQWICQLNYPTLEQLPTFELFEQESIDKLQAERDEILARCGVRFTAQYLNRVYGFEEGDIEITQMQQEQAVENGEKIANFAEFEPTPNRVEQAIDQMGELAQHHLDSNIAQIRAKLDTAESLEEFRTMLDELIPQLDYSEYAQLLAEGMTAMTLAGRYDVEQERRK